MYPKHFKLPKQVNEALALLEREGHRAYIAGACVRELLMGNHPDDYDIITDCDLTDIQYAFRNHRTSLDRIKQGEILVIILGMTIMVAPYRKAVIGNRFIIADNLMDDLARRSFAMNAIAYNPRKGLIDSFYGTDYISEGNATISLIRQTKAEEYPLDETQILPQNPTRILQAVRYVAQRGFAIEERTLQAIFDNLHTLDYADPQKLENELFDILMGKNAPKAMTLFYKVIFKVMPDLANMYGFDKDKYGMDLYTRTVNSLAFTPPLPALRLALLFKDSGVPDCLSVDTKGKRHFYGLKERSKLLAGTFMRDMNLNPKLAEDVLFLIDNWYMPLTTNRVDIKKKLALYGERRFSYIVHMSYATAGAFEHKGLQATAKTILDTIKDIIDNNECYLPDMLDISKWELVREGIINEISADNLLNALYELVLESPKMNSRVILLESARKLVTAKRKLNH